MTPPASWARRQAAEAESAGVATALKIVGYVTAAIEKLQEGDYVLSRDQDDPDRPLVGMPITRKYRRVADHLQVLDVQDAGGTPQTIHTTDEHPFFVPGQGWTKSKLLETGDGLLGPAEIGSNVTGNVRQTHPTGVVVYNMEVAGSHTYFVRAEDSDAEPVWVHNAGQGYLFPEIEAEVAARTRKPYSNQRNRPAYAEGQVEAVWDKAAKAHPEGRVFDPNTGEELFWNRTVSRAKQWDMGHMPEQKYEMLHGRYMRDEITLNEFLHEYRNPNNYRPESWTANRGHLYE